MNLVLMGLRGSGKSTLARALGESLRRTAVDLDDLTPGVLGCASVGEAWDRHGEAAFRRAEVVALSRVLCARDQVVALGGGTPTEPLAEALLRDERRAGRARVVYLSASPATLRARLAAADNTHRPSLTGADPLAEIERVHAARDALYRALADEIVEVDGLDERTTLAQLEAIARAM